MEEPSKTPKKTEVPRATKKELEQEGDPTNGRKLSLGRFSPIIMPVVLALAVSYFLIAVMAVPKGTYNNAFAGLSGRMTAIETSIEEVVTGQGDMLTSIQSLREELANYKPNTEQLDSLAIELNSIEAQVAGLDIPTSDSFLTIIDDRLNKYESLLVTIVRDIEELQQVAEEEETEEEETAAIDESTVWTKEFWSTPALDIDYSISPSRVEDEDDYIIMVYLLNYDKVVKNNVVVDIIFSPKTRDRVKVDEGEILLDSTRRPFYAWFMEVVKRSDGTCRRMVFSSEKMSIPAATGSLPPEGSGVAPGRLTLRLEFTLAYK